MEAESSVVQYLQTADTNLLLCRKCKTHISFIKEEDTSAYLQTRSIEVKDAVNLVNTTTELKKEKIEYFRYGNAKLQHMICMVCGIPLGWKNVLEGSCILFSDRLLIWTGGKTIPLPQAKSLNEAEGARQTRVSRFYSCRKCGTHIASAIDKEGAAVNPINLNTGDCLGHSMLFKNLVYAEVSCIGCNMVLGERITDLSVTDDKGDVYPFKHRLHFWNGNQKLDAETIYWDGSQLLDGYTMLPLQL